MYRHFFDNILMFLCLVIWCSLVYAQASPPSWSCLCYQERYQKVLTQVTTCRPTAVACQKLEKRVKTGSKSIVAGSLSRRCTHITGVHPETTLGGTDLWLPSAHSGSFWTPTGCWLPQDQSDVFDTGERADYAEIVSRQARGEVLISDTKTITLGRIQSRVKLVGKEGYSYNTENIDEIYIPGDIFIELNVKAPNFNHQNTYLIPEKVFEDNAIYCDPGCRDDTGGVYFIEAKLSNFIQGSLLTVAIKHDPNVIEERYDYSEFGMIFMVNESKVRHIFSGELNSGRETYDPEEACEKSSSSDFYLHSPSWVIEYKSVGCNAEQINPQTILHYVTPFKQPLTTDQPNQFFHRQKRDKLMSEIVAHKHSMREEFERIKDLLRRGDQVGKTALDQFIKTFSRHYLGNPWARVARQFFYNYKHYKHDKTRVGNKAK